MFFSGLEIDTQMGNALGLELARFRKTNALESFPDSSSARAISRPQLKRHPKSVLLTTQVGPAVSECWHPLVSAVSLKVIIFLTLVESWERKQDHLEKTSAPEGDIGAVLDSGVVYHQRTFNRLRRIMAAAGKCIIITAA
jgi:hypothetical protein